MKAEWGIDYDWRNDKCFDRPMHPECDAPIFLDKESNTYICIGCGEEAEVDDAMKEWIAERSGEKVEIKECFKCHKETFESHYHKNANTLEWELGWGECKECGMRILV